MRRSELFLLFYELIVIFMGTNPEPNIGIQVLNTQGSPIQTNSNRIHNWRIIYFFKMKRRMVSIFFPKMKCFICLGLNFFRKIRIQFFKDRVPYRFQLSPGSSSSVFPSSKSLIADNAISLNISLLFRKDSSHLIESINSSSRREATLSCKSSGRLSSSLNAFSSKIVMNLLKSINNLCQLKLPQQDPTLRS